MHVTIHKSFDIMFDGVIANIIIWSEKMTRKITDKIICVGCNDHKIDMFEGQYVVPNGMAYNSYVIIEDKTAVLDTMEEKETEEWLANVEEALEGRTPDYLIVQHMEPDHSASIGAFVEKYPETTIVGNKKTFNMISQFFPGIEIANKMEVAGGDKLSLGENELTFIMAPMVHWPEVMMTYYPAEKAFFSADAFGKFGALDVEEEWECEARRYYIGIVGKYGPQVQSVLKQAAEIDIEMICPLHGPVLDKNLSHYIDLYDTWSGYRSETEGVCICYTSVYGNTKKAVELLAEELEAAGVENVVVNDLARCDWAEAVEDAFRYDRLVLATTTYNGDIFPFMKQFIDHLTERNFQNRRIAFIENGSWGPVAIRKMKQYLESAKELVVAENNVTIKSAMTENNKAQIKALAAELSSEVSESETAGAASEGIAEEKPAAVKRYECQICKFVYEGESLPEGFECPLCGRGTKDFTLLEE